MTVRLTITDPRAKKTPHPVGVELVTLRQNGIIQPERSTTELSQHTVRNATKCVYKRHEVYNVA